MVIIIFALTIYIRTGLLKNQGLFEPDGFFYYSVIRATIGNHLMEPQFLGISGFPGHNFIGEAPGLPYLTVITYTLIGWSGIGFLAIMRWLPVLFALFECILAYLIAKELTKSKWIGLLAMFFIAVSSGNVARTAALVYRGDSFISVPLMIAIDPWIEKRAYQGGGDICSYLELCP
jgi:asparagine N-glycosylation enzyme membrane subunit Stt3